jgi:diaminohydroxyphosphoribosylaminopyrimidine deaminase/5-amino-6-(5-phosphoribosylamino)uracil reductase
MVGAVVVQGGEVVGEGWHHEYGRPHAEVEALRAAGGAARGATMYVTLEPCSHFGQTPPCTQAVLEAGVGRLVYACRDPNPAARGGGEVLREAGVLVEEGVEEESARDLNAPFFHRFATEYDRPWIHLKLALSLDARIADREGRSGWITGEEARGEVHRIRAGQDAVAVGVGTVLADDPLLTVRGEVKPRVPVARIVFDRRLRTPLDSELVRSVPEAPVWIVCSPDLPESTRAAFLDAGVQLITAADLESGLRAVREAGIESIVCEGGAELAASLLEADLVDRLTLFYAPLLLGPTGIAGFGAISSPHIAEVRRWRPLRTATFGADTLISLAR